MHTQTWTDPELVIASSYLTTSRKYDKNEAIN